MSNRSKTKMYIYLVNPWHASLNWLHCLYWAVKNVWQSRSSITEGVINSMRDRVQTCCFQRETFRFAISFDARLLAAIRILRVAEHIGQTLLTLHTVFLVPCESPRVIEGSTAETFLTVTRRNHWEVPDEISQLVVGDQFCQIGLRWFESTLPRFVEVHQWWVELMDFTPRLESDREYIAIKHDSRPGGVAIPA